MSKTDLQKYIIAEKLLNKVDKGLEEIAFPKVDYAMVIDSRGICPSRNLELKIDYRNRWRRYLTLNRRRSFLNTYLNRLKKNK